MNPKPREQTVDSWICLFVPQKRIYKPKARLVDHLAPAALGWGTEVGAGRSYPGAHLSCITSEMSVKGPKCCRRC